jgi:hypothetical protein
MSKPKYLWFERTMAIIASINLGLVLFDLSYVNWRDFWLRGNFSVLSVNIHIPLPPITPIYDQVKSIEPHRETKAYLDKVGQLEEQIAQTGLNSAQTEKILAELRNLSQDMIQTNPFLVANKSGTLERIKNRIKDHVSKNTGIKGLSSRQAFLTFWSQEYLSKYGWKTENKYFDKSIRPLLEVNYFRHIGESGQFVDNFWLIDLPFVVLFGLEFLARNYYLRKRNTGVGFIEATVIRWYDLLLLIPVFQWLRIIPVTLRLSQAKLIDLDVISKQLNRSFITNFAEELTEIVVIRLITQMQGTIKDGNIIKWLSGKTQRNEYIDINNINEVEAIAKIVINLIVHDIFPKIQTDLEVILRYNLQKTIKEIPGYNNLEKIPGLGNLANEMTEQVVKQVLDNSHVMLTKMMQDDPVTNKMINDLINHSTEAVKSELQKNQTLEKIQSLLLDMLEEVKINYVQNLSDDEFKEILEKTREMREIKSLP